MKNKIILYLTGGTMSGVFCAGVTTHLQDKNLYETIEAVYSASVGTLVGASFLSGRIRQTSPIFWEDLTNGDFLHKDLFFPAMWNRLSNRFLHTAPRERVPNLIDTEFLFKALNRRNAFDIEKIKTRGIPLYTKLFNLNTKRNEWVGITEVDFMQALEASVTLAPYNFASVDVSGVPHIDGGLYDPVEIDSILEKYPEHKVVVVFNASPNRKIRGWGKALIESVFASMMYGTSVGKLYLTGKHRQFEGLKQCSDNPRVLLVHPTDGNPLRPRTTIPAILEKSYEFGIEVGNVIEHFIYDVNN